MGDEKIDVQVYADLRREEVTEELDRRTTLCSRRDLDVEFKLAKDLASVVFNTVKKHGRVDQSVVMSLFHTLVSF